MFWIFLELKLSRRSKKASVAATHFAQQVQNPGTKWVILGLEVAPKGAHQVPHDLLHSWLQKFWIETAHMTSKSKGRVTSVMWQRYTVFQADDACSKADSKEVSRLGHFDEVKVGSKGSAGQGADALACCQLLRSMYGKRVQLSWQQECSLMANLWLWLLHANRLCFACFAHLIAMDHNRTWFMATENTAGKTVDSVMHERLRSL